MHTYNNKDWNFDFKRVQKASDYFEQMKMELALAQNNRYVGSGAGGDPSTFLFVISNFFKLIPENVENNVSLSNVDNEIVVKIPKDVTFQMLRSTIVEYAKDKYTSDQVKDVEFLKNIPQKTLELNLLIQALEGANSLIPYLDSRKSFYKIVSEFFEEDYQYIKQSFLKEMGLPLNSFDKKDPSGNGENYIIHNMLNSHPVWGAKYGAARNRHHEINMRILSSEVLERIIKLKTYPNYISLFVVRTIFTQERLITHNLDEHEGVKDILSSLIDAVVDK